MDTNLLRSWLGLPPGEWPPDPKALLGTEGAQERALALMEKLRPHQLRHPELVTEGMNRLAQALIAAERKAASTTIDLFAVKAEELPPPPPLPVILEAEVVATLPVSEAVKPPPRRKKKRRRVAPERVAVPVLDSVAPAAVVTNRRKAYRKLVRLSHVAKAWERLGPFYGVPSQTLITSVDVFKYLEAAIEGRKCVNRLKGWPVPQGSLTRTFFSHPASLALFRDLRKSQRDALAADWALALGQLQAEERSQRMSLRQSKPRGTLRQRFRAARSWIASHPESQLGLLLGISLLAALTRLLLQRD